MARQWDDRHYEMFSKLPDEEVRKVFNALPDEDKTNLYNGYKSWKQAKPHFDQQKEIDAKQAFKPFAEAAKPQPQMSGVAPSAAMMDEDRRAHMADEEAAAQAKLNSPMRKVQEYGSMAMMANPLTAVAGAMMHPKVEEEVLDPAARSFQKNIGRPMMESMIANAVPYRPPVEGESMEDWRGRQVQQFRQGAIEQGNEEAAHKLMTGMGSVFAGMSFSEDVLGHQAIEKARADMVKWEVPMLGPMYPGEVAAMVAGDPLTYTPMGGQALFGKVATKYPVLGRILISGWEGAASGAATGVISPDIDIATGTALGAGMGTTIGGGLTGTVAGAKAAAPTFKTLAVLSKEGAASLGDELATIFNHKPQPLLAADGMLPAGLHMPTEGWSPNLRVEAEEFAPLVKSKLIEDPYSSTYKPGAAFYMKDPDGNNVISFVQMQPGRDVPLTYSRLPLRNVEDAAKAGDVLKHHGITASYTSSFTWKDMTNIDPEMFVAITKGTGKKASAKIVAGGVPARHGAVTTEMPVVQKDALRKDIYAKNEGDQLQGMGMTPEQYQAAMPKRNAKGELIDRPGPTAITKEFPVVTPRQQRERLMKNKSSKPSGEKPDPDAIPEDLGNSNAVVTVGPDGVKVTQVKRPKLSNAALNVKDPVQIVTSSDAPPKQGVVESIKGNKVTVFTTEGKTEVFDLRYISKINLDEVLAEAGSKAKVKVMQKRAAATASAFAPDPEMPDMWRTVLNGTTKLHPDALARQLKIPKTQAELMLAEMEAKGYISLKGQSGGKVLAVGSTPKKEGTKMSAADAKAAKKKDLSAVMSTGGGYARTQKGREVARMKPAPVGAKAAEAPAAGDKKINPKTGKPYTPEEADAATLEMLSDEGAPVDPFDTTPKAKAEADRLARVEAFKAKAVTESSTAPAANDAPKMVDGSTIGKPKGKTISDVMAPKGDKIDPSAGAKKGASVAPKVEPAHATVKERLAAQQRRGQQLMGDPKYWNTGIQERYGVDGTQLTSRQPSEMSTGDLMAELAEARLRVMEGEKMPSPPQGDPVWALYNKGDMEGFSKARGYTPEQIKEFNRYQELLADPRAKDAFDAEAVGHLDKFHAKHFDKPKPVSVKKFDKPEEISDADIVSSRSTVKKAKTPKEITDETEKYMITEFLKYTDDVDAEKLAGFMGTTPERAAEIIERLKFTGAIVEQGGKWGRPAKAPTADAPVPPAAAGTTGRVPPVAKTGAPARGKVKAGETPTKPPEPPKEVPAEIVSEPAMGVSVYVGAVDGGGSGVKPTVGTIIGRGAGGNTMKVQMPDGTTKIHPTEHLHPVIVDGLGKGLMNPLALVPTAQPASWAQVPPATQKELEQLYKAVKNLTPDRTMFGNMKRIVEDWFLGDSVKGPREISYILARQKASSRIIRQREDIINKFDQLLPRGFDHFSAISDDVDSIMLGQMDLPTFMNKWKAQGVNVDKLAAFSGEVAERAQALSKRITDLGGVDPNLEKMRDSGQMDQYVANSFFAHILGRDTSLIAKIRGKDGSRWARMMRDASVGSPLRQRYDNLRKFLQVQNINAKLGWTMEAVDKEINSILNADDPLMAYLKSDLSSPSAHLIKRNVLPDPIQEGLGPIKGTYRAGFSLANQEVIANNLSVWDQIFRAKQPGGMGLDVNPYWSPGPRGDPKTKTEWLHVPANSRHFGRAAGGYIHPDLKPLLEVSKGIDNQISMLNMLGGFIKTNQIALGGARPIVNQVLRNWKYGMSAGLNVWNHAETGKFMAEALNDIIKWHRNPIVTKDNAMYAIAVRYGGLPSGFGRSEGMPSLQREMFERLEKDLAKRGQVQSSNDVMELMLKAVNLGKKPYTTAAKAMWGTIDLQEQVWRFAAFRKSYMEEMATATNKGLHGDEAIDYAAKRASYKVNASFPNWEHTGKVVQAIKATPFGLFAPYLSPFIEDLRIKAMIPKRLKEEPRLKWNMIATGMYYYGVYKGIEWMRRDNGITDEQVEADRQSRAADTQTYSPGMIPLWYKDDKGRIEWYDLGQPVEEFQLLHGNPEDSVVRRIAANSLMQIVSGSPSDDNVRKYLEYASLVKPVGKEPRQIHGDTGWKRLMQHSMYQSLAPGLVRSYMHDSKRIDDGSVDPNYRQEQFTPAQFAKRQFMGLPVSPGATIPGVSTDQFGQTAKRSPAQIDKGLDAISELKKLEEDLRIVGIQVKQRRRTPQEGIELKDAIIARMKELKAQITEMRGATKKAQQQAGAQP